MTQGCFGKSLLGPRNRTRGRQMKEKKKKPEKKEEEKEKKKRKKMIMTNLHHTQRAKDRLPRVSKPMICANEFKWRN